ncbi:hypothetical protein TRVL_04323 [Trypanosoma vivax]|nr:hypothetical protein TRVL_04323 [Trypanosoma vivax]
MTPHLRTACFQPCLGSHQTTLCAKTRHNNTAVYASLSPHPCGIVLIDNLLHPKALSFSAHASKKDTDQFQFMTVSITARSGIPPPPPPHISAPSHRTTRTLSFMARRHAAVHRRLTGIHEVACGARARRANDNAHCGGVPTFCRSSPSPRSVVSRGRLLCHGSFSHRPSCALPPRRSSRQARLFSLHSMAGPDNGLTSARSPQMWLS